MHLPLSLSMWIVGAITATFGVFLFRNQRHLMTWLQTMPRSQSWAIALFGSGLGWFLWHVLQLGEADFGAYRYWLFGLFLFCGIGAFRYVPDFLAVRGLAVIILLSANELLQSAYLQEPVARLTLVSWTYFLIICGIILGASPYHFLRWSERLEATAGHRKLYGRAITGIGFLVFVTGFACLGAATS